MPPKNWKKGYVKDPKDGKWKDPKDLEQKIIVENKTKPKKKKKEKPPTLKSVPDDSNYAKVLIVWRDARGRERTTQYVMANLGVREDVEEIFTNAKKKTQIRLIVEGDVLEKM